MLSYIETLIANGLYIHSEYEIFDETYNIYPQFQGDFPQLLHGFLPEALQQHHRVPDASRAGGGVVRDAWRAGMGDWAV